MGKKFLICAIFGLLFSGLAHAQSIVSGVVTSSEDGYPVIGASVFVQGTDNGVITDIHGAYTLREVPANAMIVFSYIGMKDVVKPAAATLNVTLTPDNEMLDQVVVTAQGLTRKQKAIGYSAQTMSNEELTITHSADLGNSLAGKVAGAQFWGGSGATFNEGSIVLRGATSFGDARGNEPIYVVDGAITSRAAVNMDDVESLNILKGPAATALYGSRGADGAVVITTKRAAEGRSVVDFSTTTSIETYYSHVKFTDLYGGGSTTDGLTAAAAAVLAAGGDPYATDWTSVANLLTDLGDGTYTRNDYGSDENWGPRYDGTSLVRSALSWDPTSDKYGKADTWQARLNLRDLTRTALTNNTNIAFSKAGNGYSTRVAFNNVERQGMMYNSDAVRRSFSITSTFKPAEWLNADISYRYRLRKNHNAAIEGYTDNNVAYSFIQWGQTDVNIREYRDYLRNDGSWRTWNITSPTNMTAYFHDNPYAQMYELNSYNSTQYNLITSDIYATLPFNIRVGARFNNSATHAFYEEKNNGSGSIAFESYFRTYQSKTNDFTAQGYATWSDNFVDSRLSVEAAVFAEQRAYDYYYLNSSTSGGLTLDGFYNLAASANTYSTNNTVQHYKTRSFFGTATMGWDDLLYLDGSVRYDIDSRLPDANNAFLYGGGSVSFMASKLIDASWLDFWKLRGSVAQVGSTLGVYNIYPTYSTGSKVHGMPSMYEPTSLKNPNIKPTISTSFEVGTEFKMFGNRFYGDINFYRKDTKNDIVSSFVLPQSGYSSRTVNAGLVRNQGIEIALGGTPVRTRDIEWGLNFNWSKNVNTLIEYTADQEGTWLYNNKFYYPWYLWSLEGKPVGVIISHSRLATNEEGQPILAKGNATWGDVRPTFETDVEKEVGNVQPDFTGGFSTSFRFKQFTLGASLDYVVGGQIVSFSNMWGTGSGTFASTAKVNPRGVNEREPVAVGGGVYLEGVDADGNPLSGYSDAYSYYHNLANYANDTWVYDRTYVKLRELSLRYDLPKSFLYNLGIGITKASVAFVATNPWLIYSAVPNIDPSEIGSGTDYNFLEGGQALSSRTFGLTLNITF